MEVTQVAGVRSRAPAMATMADETVDNSRPFKKRRKLSNEKLTSRSSTFVQTKTLDFEIHFKSVLKEEPSDSCDAAGSLISGGVPASCCSRTGSMEKLKVSDVKEEESIETGTNARYYLDGNESVAKSEFKAESGQLDSTAKESPEMNNSRRTVRPAAEKLTPSEAELEEFFAAAQQGLNKRFKNKYNYDIVKDIPLKGRFEWIQVKPETKVVVGYYSFSLRSV